MPMIKFSGTHSPKAAIKKVAKTVKAVKDDTSERLAKHPALVRRLNRWSRRMSTQTRQWYRRALYWSGAVVVGLIAIGFAYMADYATTWQRSIYNYNPWLMFAIAPFGLLFARWVGMKYFAGAEGSGIPQTIVALESRDSKVRNQMLSLRIAIGKIGITILSIFCGASVGREGPTVQVGASIMYRFGRWINLSRTEMHTGLILSGGAAGVAAAFNTPLAGVVFAIEELSRNFESRTSGLVLASVILAGFTSWGVLGNYHYFGHTGVILSLNHAWQPIIVCGLVGGLCGGLFSRFLVAVTRHGLPWGIGEFRQHHPLWFAAICGLLIAFIGTASLGSTYGTGYESVVALLNGGEHPLIFAPLKILATIVSYFSGIPGGIFAPSLAIGAGIGDWIAWLMPATPADAIIVLAMVGFFVGVIQAPLTGVVILLEMTDNGNLTLPLMATAAISFASSRVFSKKPIYKELADMISAKYK